MRVSRPNYLYLWPTKVDYTRPSNLEDLARAGSVFPSPDAPPHRRSGVGDSDWFFVILTGVLTQSHSHWVVGDTHKERHVNRAWEILWETSAS